MRRLLCALLGVGLLLGSCAAGEPAAVPEPESSVAAAGKSITEQEAVERVRELVMVDRMLLPRRRGSRTARSSAPPRRTSPCFRTVSLPVMEQ